MTQRKFQKYLHIKDKTAKLALKESANASIKENIEMDENSW